MGRSLTISIPVDSYLSFVFIFCFSSDRYIYLNLHIYLNIPGLVVAGVLIGRLPRPRNSVPGGAPLGPPECTKLDPLGWHIHLKRV